MKGSVLERQLDLTQPLVLEASAGTGKTFSIENLYVRRLLGMGCPQEEVDQILVVTFTRAATRELKERIRLKIEESLEILEGGVGERLPDYLLACLEEPPRLMSRLRGLRRALLGYEDAQIFTIHGFCARMLGDYALEAQTGLQLEVDENQGLSFKVVQQILKDALRSDALKGILTSHQMGILLKAHRNDITLLTRSVWRILEKGLPLCPGRTFEELAPEIFKELEEYRELGSLSAHYKGLTQCSEQIQKVESLAQSPSLTSLGAYLPWLGSLFSLFHESNIKVRSKKTYTPPPFLSRLESTLLPLIREASSIPHLLVHFTKVCQELLQVRIEEEQMSTPNDLLLSMREACGREVFQERLRERYSSVIIDEFQDTDPLQWDIFRTLFIDLPITLVGDPKQSIYAFRNADIYTYLAAREALGEDCQGTLSVNYRSDPGLVDGLNHLFSSELTPELIQLPRLKTDLPYQSVGSPEGREDSLLQDTVKSIHFFLGEFDQGRSRRWPTEEAEGVAFSFICREVQRLHKEWKIPLREQVVLVRDRFQADRLRMFLQHYGVPSNLRRGRGLLRSPIYQSLKEVLRAILQPRQLSTIKVALGTALLGWTHEEIARTEEEQSWAPILTFFGLLCRVFLESGFSALYSRLLEAPLGFGGSSVSEVLLRNPNGGQWFRDLQQLYECLVTYQVQEGASGEGLLDYLEKLKVEGEEIQSSPDPEEESVPIVTLHMSKGLEWEVVYALGLVNRTDTEELVIVEQGKEGPQLIPACPSHPAYEAQSKEADAEKMRQLYVALTRAKRRLYVPGLFSKKQEVLSIGKASPLELYFSRWLRGEGAVCLESVLPFFQQLAAQTSISYEVLSPEEPPQFSEEEKNEGPLISPKVVEIPGEPSLIHSFTSLAHPFRYGGEETPPQDWMEEKKCIETLPAGSETGVLLHSMMEQIQSDLWWGVPSFEELTPWVEGFLRDPKKRPWSAVFSQLLYRALRAPLGEGSLLEVPPQRVLRELSFLHPASAEKGCGEEDFLRGVMDVFLEMQGRFYVMDWKTNWLTDYSLESLQKSMKDHDYFLQAGIYAQAARRYLEMFGRREDFAGVYYVYVRGLHKDEGVLFLPGEELL